MTKCLECDGLFSDEVSLHRHFRTHKLKINDYYFKHFGRKDLLTGEPIPFKDSGSYFSTFFLNRTNCLEYIKKLPQSERRDFVKKLLTARKEHKNLKYAPSTIELRTTVLPSVVFLQKNGLNYFDICQEVGLINKYIYPIPKFCLLSEGKTKEIIIDTREQNPLIFNKKHTIIRSALSFGDYTCRSDFKNIFIERKSALDFIGTFSGQIDRFKRELQRAKEMGARIIVLCEVDFQTILNFNYIPFYKNKTKATPDYVFHNVREVLQEFDNVDFAFVDGRKEMVRVIEKIFDCPNIIQFDLQFLIDRGDLEA